MRPDAGLLPATPAPADAPPPRILDEAEGKACLAAAGIAVPEGVRADTAADAAKAALSLAAPLVLKRLGVAHKTEEAAVALNLAAEDIKDAATAMGPGPYLVEEMVQNIDYAPTFLELAGVESRSQLVACVEQ